jgi:hypothetical protein
MEDMKDFVSKELKEINSKDLQEIDKRYELKIEYNIIDTRTNKVETI